MVGTADQINTSLNTISDWKHEWTTSFGIVFNKVGLSALDDAATRHADEGKWWSVRHVKRMAEIIGYSSEVLNQKTRLMLTNQLLFSSGKLPKTWNTDYWWNWDWSVLDCFRWAKELNHETAKWDSPLGGYTLLRNKRRSVDTIFYAYNPDTGETLSMLGGRWHQVGAICGAWLRFYELGIEEAKQMAQKEWDFLNEKYWDVNHYIYAPELPNFEFRCPDVFQTFTKAYVSQPFVFGTNFPRVAIDLQKRYLIGGWDAPQWGGKYVTVHHYPSNLEQRLDGMHCWAVLHMFYRHFEETNKLMMRKMLLGEDMISTSEALLRSPLFNSATNRFRDTDTGEYSDPQTIWGCVILFLTSIVPYTASVAIPVQVEGFGATEWAFFNPTHFGFNYERKQIKIPVYAGKLQFKFGTTPVEASFPYDGIYTVSFTDDWNGVKEVKYLANLTGSYLDPPHSPTVMDAEMGLLTTALAAYPITQFSRFLIKKVKERS
jgi:hypothetical protein